MLNPNSLVLCAGCNRPIFDRYLLHVLDKAWHSTCVRCSECKILLVDKCFTRENRLFCKDDFLRRFGTKCAGCNQIIAFKDLIRKARDKVFHIECFCCTCCQKRLDTGEELYIVNGCKFLCKEDYCNSSRHMPSVVDGGVGSTGATSDCCSGDDDDDDELTCSGDAIDDSNDVDDDDGSTSLFSSPLGVLGVGGTHAPKKPPAARRRKQPVATNGGINDHSSRDSSPDGAAIADEDDVRGGCAFKGTGGGGGADDVSSRVKKRGHISHIEDDVDTVGGGGSVGVNGGGGGSSAAKRRGPRTTIKAKQLETLKAAFASTPKPTRHVREHLANETGLNMRVIQVWFQNRRSKERRMKQLRYGGFRPGSRRARNALLRDDPSSMTGDPSAMYADALGRPDEAFYHHHAMNYYCDMFGGPDHPGLAMSTHGGGLPGGPPVPSFLMPPPGPLHHDEMNPGAIDPSGIHPANDTAYIIDGRPLRIPTSPDCVQPMLGQHGPSAETGDSPHQRALMFAHQQQMRGGPAHGFMGCQAGTPGMKPDQSPAGPIGW